MKERKLYEWKGNENAVGTIVLFFILPILWPFAFFVVPLLLHSATYFVITNRRVRIKTVSGLWKELPMDQISAVARTYWWGKLFISSPSATIAVWGFKDRDKVFELLSKRMIERQDEQITSAPAAEELPDL